MPKSHRPEHEGQADANAVRRIEPRVTGSRADESGSGLTGLHRPEVEPGLRQHEAAQGPRLRCTVATEQALPRQRRRPTGRHAGQRLAEGRQGGLQRCQRRLAAAHSLERKLQGVHQAAHARIGGERAEQGLGGDQPLGGLRHLIDAQEEQAVAGEEGTAVGTADGLEQIGACGDASGELGARPLGQLGRGAVDDDRDQVGAFGKSRVEDGVALPPRHVRSDEFGAVGVDGECARVVKRGQHEQQAGEHGHPARRSGTGH